MTAIILTYEALNPTANDLTKCMVALARGESPETFEGQVMSEGDVLQTLRVGDLVTDDGMLGMTVIRPENPAVMEAWDAYQRSGVKFFYKLKVCTPRGDHRRVVAVTALDPFTTRVDFDNGARMVA